MFSEAQPFTGVIALDGPAGTGKSTVAQRLAARLGAQYLDTGAMYRAATVAVLRAGADPADPAAVLETVAASRIEVSLDPQRQRTLLDGQDVSTAIRGAETTAAVSAVSAVPEVRERLVAQQRELIGRGPTVAEGRDIGSVVWPQAELKVYLTAREEVRAQRRAGQLGQQDLAGIAESMRRRDAFDSGRAASPLRRPDGAVEVDTSDLGIDDVVTVLADLARQAMPVSAAHRD
ncbi:MAG TPA: (d)CMP kinase [Jatrophihabitans sp.]|nr:(d)CMP kinase [Jatrophihabitans sp.]